MKILDTDRREMHRRLDEILDHPEQEGKEVAISYMFKSLKKDKFYYCTIIIKEFPEDKEE